MGILDEYMAESRASYWADDSPIMSAKMARRGAGLDDCEDGATGLRSPSEPAMGIGFDTSAPEALAAAAAAGVSGVGARRPVEGGEEASGEEGISREPSP